MSTPAERSHHRYSPSSLESLEACPCYIGRESTHERTTAGTKAHKVVESRKDDETLSDDDAVAVAECLDLTEKRRAVLTATGGVAPLEIKEEYMPVDEIKFPDGVFSTTAGFADTILVSLPMLHAEILDWKFGNWPVTDAEHNPQGIAYALGVFHRFPKIESVTVWFVQPLIGKTTSWTFHRKEIPALYLRVSVIVARARAARAAADFAAARPAVPLCNFCGNIGTCPKVAEFACRVGHKFFPLEIGENITPTMILNSTDTDLGMRLASVVRVWAEAFRKQVTERVIARRAAMPAGFKLEVRTERSIVDMAKLKEIALKYLTPAEFESTLSTTFGGLETIISDNAPRGSKKEALQAFKKELEDSAAVKRGEPYMFLKAIAADKK